MSEAYPFGTNNNRRIQKFTPSGALIWTFADSPGPGFDGFWYDCKDISVDQDGYVFLLDDGYSTSYLKALSCFDPAGNFVDISENLEQMVYSPTRLETTLDGHVLVTAENAVVEFDRNIEYVSHTWGSWYNTLVGICALGEMREFFLVTSKSISFSREVFVLGQGPLALNILDSDWLDESFQLKCDQPSLLATCDPTSNYKLRGITADGVSPALIRLELPFAGEASISLRDSVLGESEGLGTISPLCGTPTGGPITVASEVVDGRNIVFAEYISPADFDRPGGGDENATKRTVQIKFEISFSEAPNIVDYAEINLPVSRVPIVFVHGIFSNPETWETYYDGELGAPYSENNGFRPYTIDYKNTNGSYFSVNTPKISEQISAYLRSQNDRAKIATAQVDIVAHSMGGNLARKIFQDSWYWSAKNMGKGYFHKLLVMNVPNYGSHWANFGMAVQNKIDSDDDFLSAAGLALKYLFAASRKIETEQVFAGAMEDLTTGSAELNSLLGEINVPTRAHIGEGSDLLLPQLAMCSNKVGWLIANYLAIEMESLIIFDDYYHDWVVFSYSQRGDLLPQYCTVSEGCSGVHTEATKRENTGSLVDEYIHTSIYDSEFFSPSWPVGTPQTPDPLDEDGLYQFSGLNIQIDVTVNDVSINEVIPGQVVNVGVDPVGGQNILSACVVSSGGSLHLLTPQFEEEYTVPQEAYGRIILSAGAIIDGSTLGKALGDTLLAYAVPETLMVSVLASVDSISVFPKQMTLGNTGSIGQLYVSGVFSDGVIRKVGEFPGAVSFSSDNPGFASVNEMGIVQALGQGSAIVTVIFDGHQKEIPITVLDGPAVNNLPHANAGGIYSFCANEPLLLDGSNSYDYDTARGDALSYFWDYDRDGLADATGPTVSYTVDIDHPKVVILTVQDSFGEESKDYALLVPRSVCYPGTYVCEAGDEVGTHDPFFTVKDVASYLPDNGFAVLDQSVVGIQSVHKFSESCDYEFSITLDDTFSSMSISPPGIFHFLDCESNPFQLIRYLPDGTPFSPKELPDNPGELCVGYSGVGFDSSSEIYINYELNEPGKYNIYIYNVFGDLEQIIDLTSFGNAKEFCVAPDGGIYLGLEGGEGWEIVYLENDNGVYSESSRWGDPGDGPGQLSAVCDLTTLDGTEVFVCESTRVQRFSQSGEYIYMATGPGGEDGGPEFLALNSVSINNLGNLVVGDDGADRAYVFRIEDDQVTPVFESNDDIYTANSGGALVLISPGIFPGGQSSEFYFETGKNLNSVRLKIFDVRGRLVRNLDVGAVGSGRHPVPWDSKDNHGKQVASGVYLLMLEGDGQIAVGKAIIIR